MISLLILNVLRAIPYLSSRLRIFLLLDLKVTDRDFSLKHGGINNSYSSLLQGIFPIIDIATSLGKAVVLYMGDTNMHVSFCKDNVDVLLLARNFPPQFTPHSK